MLGKVVVNFVEGIVGKIIEYEYVGSGLIVIVCEGMKRNGDVIVWKEEKNVVDLI